MLTKLLLLFSFARYDRNLSRHIALHMTDRIKFGVRALGYARYKTVCTVTVTSNAEQSCHAVSRCSWNEDTDHHITHVFKNDSMTVIAVVYLIYLD